MKIAPFTLLAVVASAHPDAADDGDRDLHATGCWNSPNEPAEWHPQYAAGWAQGYCRLTVDCNSPGYSTEVACCKGAYSGQITGYCLSRLPSPPTTSPTETGGLDVYYPDYETPWDQAGCKNERPMPNGRPTYATQLACCKGAYGGQMSGVCLSQLPAPPTTSPTGVGGLDIYYPDYETTWSDAGCKNDAPAPGGRPTYNTQLACCKGAYGGQMSGVCLSQLPAPPTMSPTETGGLDVYYPDYGTPWADAYCLNERPMPSGRPTYDTMLACCKAAYGGQMSGKCLSMLPSPPTTSPTNSAYEAAFWYPRYEADWASSGCSNKLPLPYGNVQDRPNYATHLECCAGAYAGQTSGVCLSEMLNPPTSAPTGSDYEADFWYPDYDTPWDRAACRNDLPLPFTSGGRPTYDTMLACCKAAYASQSSGACLAALPAPPTATPTGSDYKADFWYPDYDTPWDRAVCKNDLPLPFTSGGRPTYDTLLACCKAAYASQSSGACLATLPAPPTASPTGSGVTGGLDQWYPTYANWETGRCINTAPLPSGRVSYATEEACCAAAYGTQINHYCMCQVNACYSCKCTGTGSAAASAANCPAIDCS